MYKIGEGFDNALYLMCNLSPEITKKIERMLKYIPAKIFKETASIKWNAEPLEELELNYDIKNVFQELTINVNNDDFSIERTCRFLDLSGWLIIDNLTIESLSVLKDHSEYLKHITIGALTLDGTAKPVKLGKEMTDRQKRSEYIEFKLKMRDEQYYVEVETQRIANNHKKSKTSQIFKADIAKVFPNLHGKNNDLEKE